ncbi:hypothetical protein [Dyella sp. C9]|uniref:hypothetical protein n=1 Tax=Dyella sp. C9 TaxID=2202154 RepID=UPI001300B17B|nr:hypothetical protein [Dyella sp. C9]
MRALLWSLAAAVLFSTAWVPTAGAVQNPPDFGVKADTRDDFDTVAARVREQMSPGGRFEFVTVTEHQTVESDLTRMQASFDRFGNVSAMDAPAKIQLYNDQSEINAILTRRDGDREVCESALPTGSNIPRTTCRKYSDIERDRRDTMKIKYDMYQVQNTSNSIPKPGGGH